MKALSIHIDRLMKVLERHGAPFKRHQTLDLAAAAFGYHNQNELTAAAKAGDLNPPVAEPVGEVTLPSGETVIVVRDPLANASYAVDQTFVEQVIAKERAELFGPTPYGHLVNLSRLLDDAVLPLRANLAALDSDAVLEIPLFIAEVDHKHGTNLYIKASDEELTAEVAEYCRSSLFNDRAMTSSAEPVSDLNNVGDREIISQYFETAHEEHLRTYTEALTLPASLLRQILGASPASSSQRKRATPVMASTASAPGTPPTIAHPDASQVIAQFDSVWDDHPDYPSEDWQLEVENGDTRRGYWDWVAAKVEEDSTGDEDIGDECCDRCNNPLGTSQIGLCDSCRGHADADDADDRADLPPVRAWVTDEPDTYAGGLLYTTNGCQESAHGGPRLFQKLGLEWSIDDDGFFYPLTEKESQFVGEDGIELPNGFWPHMAYSCLYEGKKFACPTIEVPFGRKGEVDRDRALATIKAYADDIRAKVEAVGGHVIVEEDEPDTESHTLQVLIPFDWIVQKAGDFDEWKIKLARLMMPASGPKVMAEFTPQVWVGDQTMAVDPQGDTTWDVTAEIVAMGRQKARQFCDDRFCSDGLRYSFNAPQWVQDWSGPFYVEIQEQITAFYEALDGNK